MIVEARRDHIHCLHYDSPLGPLVLAARTQGLIGVWFMGQKHFKGVNPDWRDGRMSPLLMQVAGVLDDYFAGRPPDVDMALVPDGTAFQQRVWQALRTIAYGQCTTYGAIARQIGSPSAVRAVAAAIGRNPISIIVPCHRVLGADGSLTGYAGGLARKRQLLAIERDGVGELDLAPNPPA